MTSSKYKYKAWQWLFWHSIKKRGRHRITHFTAQVNKEREVGYFIPFDAFFNKMFNTNLTHRGRKAISQAAELIYAKHNSFARQVVNWNWRLHKNIPHSGTSFTNIYRHFDTYVGLTLTFTKKYEILP